jgi:hypothetical protein
MWTVWEITDDLASGRDGSVRRFISHSCRFLYRTYLMRMAEHVASLNPPPLVHFHLIFAGAIVIMYFAVAYMSDPLFSLKNRWFTIAVAAVVAIAAIAAAIGFLSAARHAGEAFSTKAGAGRIDAVKCSFFRPPSCPQTSCSASTRPSNDRHRAADGCQRLRPLRLAVRLF